MTCLKIEHYEVPRIRIELGVDWDHFGCELDTNATAVNALVVLLVLIALKSGIFLNPTGLETRHWRNIADMEKEYLKFWSIPTSR